MSNSQAIDIWSFIGLNERKNVDGRNRTMLDEYLCPDRWITGLL